MPGLGQGHNQKKDTHALDFDVTLRLGLKQLTSLVFYFAKSLLAKNVLMTAQKDYGLGNRLFTTEVPFLVVNQVESRSKRVLGLLRY